MLLLVSGATRYPRSDSVGHLVMPRQWNDPKALQLQPNRWAMDNGCFIGFDPGAYMRMLYAFKDQPDCLFTVVPDVVGDAASTLELWRFWSPVVRATGRALAFVAQNGLTHDRVPWGQFETLFIGGDDDFKESTAARSLCAYAASVGVWVHWGRVNGQRRYRKAVAAGADSIDGTGFSMAPDTNIPLVEQWDAALIEQPALALDGDA